MAKKKSQTQFTRKGKKGRKASQQPVEKDDLDRFAGSSDEDDVGEPKVEPKALSQRQEPKQVAVEHEADDEESDNDEEAPNDEGDAEGRRDAGIDATDEPFVTNADANVEEEAEPSEKMAAAMAKILGTSTTAKTSSIVLAKTTTPLQRLQQKEKEKMKALKQKRQANKERNLAALHIPLSVATSNNIGEGRLSITKELEQERFHRRVATRGVVALFNAISQHQNATAEDEVLTKKNDANKLTKHGFLDKIKNAAASMDATGSKTEEKAESKKPKAENVTGKWNALKDDFMMKSKKNWDEESSDEDGSAVEDPEEPLESEEVETKRNKRRKVATSN